MGEERGNVEATERANTVDPAQEDERLKAARQSPASAPFFWVASTYFAEGFPYSVVHQIPVVLFKSLGATLEQIGLTALFHLPWNLKFLWGPFLDGFSTKRKWLVGVEVVITALLVVLAFASQLTTALTAIAAVFLVLAVFSATHDIAIDGYYLEGLTKDEQSQYVGFRAAAYRIAMLVVSGALLVVAGTIGWFATFLIAAGIMGVLLAYHWLFLPKVETAIRPLRAMFTGDRARTLSVAIAGIGLLGVAIRALVRSPGFQEWRTALVESSPLLAKMSIARWIAVSLLAVLLLTAAALPLIRKRLGGSDSFYARAFVDFLDQKHALRILAFIILFRAGESFLQMMRFPFLEDATGMSVAEYGIASGTVGLIASFVSTLLGGFLIAKHGLKRWIWPMVLAQNCLNLLFMFVAMHAAGVNADAAFVAGADVANATSSIAQAIATGGDVAAVSGPLVVGVERVPFWLITCVIAVESFGAGLGTAVFMVYIMRCCLPQHKAAHMALLTALMSLAFTIAGVSSGFLAESFGYATYFGFTFIATVPGMLLIFFIPHLDDPKKSA